MLFSLKTLAILCVMFCSHMKAIDNGNGKVVIKNEGFRKRALRWCFENGNLFSFIELCLACYRLRDSPVRVRMHEHETNGRKLPPRFLDHDFRVPFTNASSPLSESLEQAKLCQVWTAEKSLTSSSAFCLKQSKNVRPVIIRPRIAWHQKRT